MIPWELYVFLGFILVAITLGSFILLKETDNHLKWIREQEKFWDDMKKEREERENNEN
jgi:hypothetical protein